MNMIIQREMNMIIQNIGGPPAPHKEGPVISLLVMNTITKLRS